MQIDISMTVISLLLSSDLAADSFFVLVRTYQLGSKTNLNFGKFPAHFVKKPNCCGTFTKFRLINNL